MIMKIDFSQAANPEQAEHFYSEFCQSFKTHFKKDFQPEANQSLLKIFGNSRFLSQYLIQHPECAQKYQDDQYKDKEKPLSVFTQEINSLIVDKNRSEKVDLFLLLKKYKYQEYLRLTLKELYLKNQYEIYREFSHLAFAISQLALSDLKKNLEQKHTLSPQHTGDYTLIAMGKLGGLELNYSSDIDLIGLYECDETNSQKGKLNNHEFYCKLFSEFGKRLSQFDAHGFLYRVDWDLRPEGKTGTLANSFAAMESYYSAFIEEWERQAYIKANVIYENHKLGKEFLKMMHSFTYRKYLDAKAINNIQDMKSKIMIELNKKKIDGVHIKLGHGGIRDIEFLTQAFQLLHGGKIKGLKTTNTVDALQILDQENLLPKETITFLKQSYYFLRRIESALQMENEQQIHVIKNNPQERLKVARRLGLNQNESEAVDILNEKLSQTLTLVSETYKKYLLE